MSTHRIRPGSSVTEWLSALASATGGTGAAAAAATARPAAKRAAQARDLAPLRRQLARLVEGADLDSDAALRALRRPVLREMLIWEFGPDVREHPEWTPMLDTIEQALESAPDMQARFAGLVRGLRQG